MKRGKGYRIIAEIMLHQPTRDEAIELGSGRSLVWLDGVGPWVSEPAFPSLPAFRNRPVDPLIVV